MSGTNLYAGGYFTNSGGVPANYIAKWDGSAWSTLGSGMNNTVWALAVSGTNLYVGGDFMSAGGVLANHIAKWDGSGWSALGSGIDGSSSSVRALAAQGEVELFVGGQFYLAGAKASPYIAEAVLLPGVPTILSPPQTQTAGVGSTVKFRVEVSGPGPLADQWFFNATNIVSGETNSILQLTDLQLSQSGAYSVVVANAYGSVTSSPALLTVTAAPAIAAPPTNQKTLIGGTAEFSVVAGGILPLAYQWFFNANAVLGATDSTLQLTNVQPWQAGGYTVVVTNAYGSTTSAPAVLEVVDPGTVVSASEAALRDAMAATQTVTFACDGTITLGSPIVISTNIVLDGSGHEITISGSDAVQVFKVLSNVTFTLLNVTIARGRCTNGGAIYNAGSVNASNCAFVGNVAQGQTNAPASGGALFNQGWLNLAGCVFTANLAFGVAGSACVTPPAGPPNDPVPGQGALGGAIASSGTLIVDLCTFVQNAADAGDGGLGCDGLVGQPGHPGGAGGAAYGGAISSSGALSVSRSTFVGNGVYGGIGGQGGPGGSTGGTGAAGGTGGSADGSAVSFSAGTVASSTFVSNGVAGGAGGSGGGGGYAASDMEAPGTGGPGGSGGAALGVVCGAMAMIVNCTLAQNTATGGAGGQGGWGGAPAIRGYPLGLGGAGGSGATGLGGLWSCTSVNCTVASNSGSGGNGGTGGSGRIAGANGANGSAGGGASASTLANTLLATNSPGNGWGTLTDLGHNLSSDNTCNFTNVGSLNNTDPRLGPLQTNGGATLTMALLADSPAINAADNAPAPPTDQRDFPRPVGPAADIGAYELCYQPVLRIDPPQAGLVSIRAYGTNGQTCRLLAGPNLSDWTPMATNQLGSDETVLFYDTYDPGSACRFYRLVMP